MVIDVQVNAPFTIFTLLLRTDLDNMFFAIVIFELKGLTKKSE